MERPSTSLRASKFLPLMVFAQAQLSSAYPFAPRIDAETGELDAGPRPHFAPNHVLPPPLEGMDPTSWPSMTATDDTAAHWTKLPVVQIPDGQIQAPVEKPEEFTEAAHDWESSSSSWSSAAPAVLTATEWSTVSTATVFDWPESTPELPVAPSGEILTSTVWSVESTATITNWDAAASTDSQAAPLTTSQSLPPSFEVQQKGATSLSSNSSALMAIEVSIQKTYSRSSDSTNTAQLQDVASQSLPLFASAASSTSAASSASAASSTSSAEASPTPSPEVQVDDSTSLSAVATSSSPRTTPLMYGSITLTYTTIYDTTSGFPATAEIVSRVASSSSASTIDFYNPNPPSTAQDSVASTSLASPAIAETNTAIGDSDTRPSPVFYSEPTSGVAASTTVLLDTASTSMSFDVTPSSVPDSSLIMLSTSAVQTAAASSIMNNEASVIPITTSLNMDGRTSVAPFPTSLVTSSVVLSLNDTVVMSNVGTTTKLSLSVSNIFQAIATDAPPAQLARRSDHPAPRKGIQPQEKKLQTNKFYSNFFLEDQAQPAYVFPYSVVWANGTGATGSYGMAVSHTERMQFAGGETDPVTGAWRFYASPIGVHSVILSATELTHDTQLTTDSLEAFSVNVNLSPASDNTSMITYPLVQGMGFVTARYTKATPVLSSGVGFQNITYIGAAGDNTTHKYRLELINGFSWLAYVTPQDTSYDVNTFTLLDGNTIQGPSGFQGTIQVAKVPAGTSDAVDVYDSAAGAYPTSGGISGSVEGTTGRYTLAWQKGGVQTQELLMFALPHHMQSLSDETKGAVTDVKLMTTVKGNSVAIRGSSWTLVEPELAVDMEFAPYQPGYGSIRAVSAEASAAINSAGASELQQDMSAMSNLDSMYYSGKELAKYAGIVFAVNDMAKNASLAQDGLERLKIAMSRFVNNTQKFPLVYEEAWGGAASSATYDTGDSGQDFGNSFYNDHHFHYGYHVYAAAVIAYLDPTWLEAGTNKAWVNTLVRDYANSVTDDPYFPFSRNFDFYHGHSWAKGLFASADGKDQESSSEDTMASYAIKMWGSVTGDKAMESRGNLMLAIQARSLDNYYLYRDSNEVQPREYIGNRAAGIMFENKIDHVTYFGNNIEYVQGINMIPIMPFSTTTRRRDFVQTEWDQFFAKNISSFQSGWRGILMANQALINPDASYAFFSNSSGDYTDQMLDGGASRTWYLAYAAGLKEAEDAGYRSPLANASKSKRSALPEIPRPTKQWVDGQLVDCDEANQEDMEAGVLQMHGELEHDHETTAQENRDGKAFITGEPVSEASVASHPSAKPQTQDQPQDQPKDQDTPARYTPGQLINCDDSNQEDMEAGILQMYNELEQQKDSASLQPEVVKQSGDFEIKRRNRIGISGSPRLRQRARG
jgi:endo-1,3(4)-beta-glucanase